MRRTLNYATRFSPCLPSALPGTQSIEERRNATARSPSRARSDSLHRAWRGDARRRAGRHGRGRAGGAHCSIRSSSPRPAAPSARSTCRVAIDTIDGDQIQRRAAADQPVRIAGARARHFAARAGRITRRTCRSSSRLRRAREFRRARRAAVPGRHSGDDAGRAGADRQLQPRSRRSGSKCCAVRSRRCTATRRAASSRCSPRTDRRRRRRRRKLIGGSYGTWNADRQARGHARRRRLRRRRQSFRHRRLPRPRAASRELVNAKLTVAARRDTHDHGDRQLRSTSRRRRIRSASRARSGRPNPRQADPAAIAVRHAQDGQPAAGRRDGRAALRRRHRSARDRLWRHAAGAAVPRAVRAPGRRRRAASPTSIATSAASTRGSTTRLALVGRPLDADAGRRLRNAAASSGRASSTTTASLGDLRRDEDDTVSNTDGYAAGRVVAAATRCRCWPACATATSGSAVDDHYVIAGNPDDSGQPQLQPHEPGRWRAVWHVDRPTQRLRELWPGLRDADVRRTRLPAGGHGPQPRRCSPRVSNSGEIGLKALFGAQQRLNLAAFDIETTDEIVINTATGGRTTYRNAAKTRRRGFEAAWEGDLGAGFAGYASLHVPVAPNYADASRPACRRCWCPRARGCPAFRRSSAYGELAWTYPAAYGWLQRGGRGPVRGQDLRQRPQHGRRAGVHDRQSARRLRAAQRDAGSSASSPALNNFTNRNYVGIGDRRRHQRPLLRAVGDRATSSSA